MNTYYASLVRGLCGYYVKFRAPDEMVVREHLCKYFGRMWCSVYSPDHMVSMCKQYATDIHIINEDDPIELTVADWE